MAQPSLRDRTIAEFIGTFWLVLGGCGSAALAAAFPSVGIGQQLWLFWVAPIVGAVLGGIVYPLISGPVEEPAVTGIPRR